MRAAWIALLLAACQAAPSPVTIAPLGDAAALERLRATFVRANPGYDFEWLPAATGLAAATQPRVVFVQEGSCADAAVAAARSALSVGDIVLLRPQEALELSEPVGLLVFRTPDAFPGRLPAFIRPDWDPGITDTPGGCATETGAYRRILLTWLAEKGPYVYHGLNAHRVRIWDSFTHYHPRAGGFDELYLVQAAPAGAQLLAGDHVARIESPEQVRADEAMELLRPCPLRAGDLVYIRRGVAHRGLGGVLAQVITVPGFRPGAEIGLDHHLRAIHERLQLPVPYHAEASAAPVIR
ncbi:MAG: hypothetical protein EYC70_01710 [Planctomycetota bacterium]|nr:MAG: hypothetical protein EYC70_01710 [Planctomycetota bacterium]